MTSAIKVENLTKLFEIKNKGFGNFLSKNNRKRELLALDNVSFTVEKGESIGIIGLNGSGKSTLLKILANLLPPTSGKIKISGQIAPLMQIGVGFQGDLNASENIVLNGLLLGYSKRDMKKKITPILKFAELENFSEMKLKHFSSGMRARLAFSSAIHMDYDILLIDEVLSVGDIKFKQKSYEAFLEFKNQQKTIIHVTHNLGKLEEYSDRVLLLHQGKLISIGNPKEIISEYKKLNH